MPIVSCKIWEKPIIWNSTVIFIENIIGYIVLAYQLLDYYL